MALEMSVRFLFISLSRTRGPFYQKKFPLPPKKILWGLKGCVATLCPSKQNRTLLSFRQIEETRVAELAEGTKKLQERKRLAEEAFQQWLRRKRDQLRMEKRMRQQQRKLDHQANYARTRTQCEEAYKEYVWAIHL